MPSGVMHPLVQDPYSALGVSKDASAEEIRSAFRRLARKYHPDHNPGDSAAAERFQEINAAHQLLADPSKRRAYDQRGANWEGNSSPPFEGAGFGGFPGGLDELFRQAFGGKRDPAARGDLSRTVTVSFEEAALGCKKNIEYDRVLACKDCGGRGGRPNTAMRRCNDCAGSGRVSSQAGGFLAAAMSRPCPTCIGRGAVPDQPCGRCDGRGLMEEHRTITVSLPPGIEDGAAQALAGAGTCPAPGAQPGDLELIVGVEPHATLRREGDDVYSDLELPFALAALGGELKVTTLHGEATLKVPSGSQSGQQLKLKAKGIPHRFRSGMGDHVFNLHLTIPTDLSDHAKAMVRDFEQALAQTEQDGLMGRLRALFD